MKCHYITHKEVGRVLIPYCWPVVLSNDIKDCTCKSKNSKSLEARVESLEKTVKQLKKEIKSMDFLQK